MQRADSFTGLNLANAAKPRMSGYYQGNCVMSGPLLLDDIELYSGINADTPMTGFGGTSGFGSPNFSNSTPASNNNGFNFTDLLQLGVDAFGGGGFNANDPLGSAQQAGNQLAYNLGQSAGTASLAAQGLGIKGQLMGAGTGLLGEDAQLNRETTAILRGQQLNQTNLAKEGNAQAI